MTDRQAYHYVESLRLGLSEFDGLTAYGRSSRTRDGWNLSCGWANERYVEAFRRSSFYARVALSPNVVDFRDVAESVETDVRPVLAIAA